jgi:hypothetical protein
VSGVAIALQGVLSLLLVAALAYGVRLERKLRDLREGQAGFAKAVQELNQAAGRAEAGLQMLRTSTEVAREELADRIDTARGLTARLEAAASDAALAVKRLEAARASHPFPQSAPSRLSAGTGGRAADVRASESMGFGDVPTGGPTLAASRPVPTDRREGTTNAPTARRPRSDEDLFLDKPVAESPADRLRQVADLLRGPTPAAGGRR